MSSFAYMKLTLQVQLLPNAKDAGALRATMERFNAAATWLAGRAFEAQCANKIALQKRHYYTLRERFGLSAQMAVRCIAQTVEAYKRDKAIRPVFRAHAAVPYDQRLMSFKGPDRVSLLTLTGRVLVPILMGRYQRERFTNAKGQSDLVLRRDGKWFLLVTVDIPDGTPIPATEFAGVDLGVVNLATTSDGAQFTGAAVERVRVRCAARRRRLQRAATKKRRSGKRPRSIRRALTRVGAKEARFRKHENHCISKHLVTLAKDTKRGLAVEDLKHIRARIRFQKAQRARLGGWAFAQLQGFLKYKAQLHGVPFVVVNAAYTSQTCSACGHCDEANRRSQADFVCTACGWSANADWNAAQNIAARAVCNAAIGIGTPQPQAA